MAERAEPVLPARTSWPLLPVLRRMAAMPLRDPFAFTGLLIYVLFALVALFADQLAPVDPLEILFTKAGKLAANVAPSADFPLGTTNLGRDIYAQLVHGTRSALAVAVLLWPNSARVIRSQVLTLRERAYVEAARVTGASPWRILFVHIAPNILPLSFVYAAIAIGWAIITEAGVCIILVVVAGFFISRGYEEVFMPRLRGR